MIVGYNDTLPAAYISQSCHRTTCGTTTIFSIHFITGKSADFTAIEDKGRGVDIVVEAVEEGDAAAARGLLYAPDPGSRTVSTIGEERAFNPRLQVKSVDQYVELMNNLNLPNPKMMDVAVPANMRVGLAQEEIARRGWAVSASSAALTAKRVAGLDRRSRA